MDLFLLGLVSVFIVIFSFWQYVSFRLNNIEKKYDELKKILKENNLDTNN